MSTNVPGRLLDGLVIPPNWEFAYGYPQERREQGHRFIAVWWTPCGDEAMVADGRMTVTAEWMVFEDLALLLERAGRGEVRRLLGFSDAEATHVLLLDLEERTVRVAPYREALEWLEKVAPVPKAASPLVLTEEDWERLQAAVREAVEQARAAMEGKAICPTCWGLGWVRAEDWPTGGYVPCGRCDGGLVPVKEVEVQQKR